MRVRVLAAALVLLSAGPRALAQDPIENEVRAVYLYNFARFIEWPAAAFPAADTPIRICVQGSDPFGATLDRVVTGEAVNGRPIQAVRLTPNQTRVGCHILYVAASENGRLSQVLTSLRGRPTLTVGEHQNFLRAGGMIRFRRLENRVRFDINLDTLEQGGLRVSSRLLAVAADVRRENLP
jgi:hypothetical protein